MPQSKGQGSAANKFCVISMMQKTRGHFPSYFADFSGLKSRISPTLLRSEGPNPGLASEWPLLRNLNTTALPAEFDAPACFSSYIADTFRVWPPQSHSYFADTRPHSTRPCRLVFHRHPIACHALWPDAPLRVDKSAANERSFLRNCFGTDSYITDIYKSVVPRPHLAHRGPPANGSSIADNCG